jgi:hypothetical protein
LVLVLVFALALAAVPAWGEVYVEVYSGGVFGAGTDMNPGFSGASSPGPGVTFSTSGSFHLPGRFHPAVQGGLKVGTWFVPRASWATIIPPG